MGFSNIIQSILIILVMTQVSSLTLHTTDVFVFLQEDNFTLNCTYQIDTNDRIPDGSISWQKQIKGEFKDIAFFSTPNNSKPFISGDMQHFYENRTKLISPNTSFAAVMIIQHPVCTDEGIYRCLIQYFANNFKQNETRRSAVNFKLKAIEPDEFLAFPEELEENQSIRLTCSADVGSPRGYVQIWKTTDHFNKDKLIYTSNSTNVKTNNCSGYINMTTTYTVTRDDNGAQFRCSSLNNLTEGPGLSKKSSKISVKYGPSYVKINASFSNSNPFIGENVTMKCVSDGNPNPNFTWKFNLTDVMGVGKYSFSADKSGISFTITNITDNGYYQCVASNNINGKLFNSSLNVTLTVQEKNNKGNSSYIEQTCSENTCLIIENCELKNGRESCTFNIWSVIAFLFIALTFILCSATFSLLLSRIKKQKKDNIKKGFHIGDVNVSYTKETFEDFGGYADPKDVKRPENGKIKSDRDGRDNPYADPVDFQTQYAVVQKNWETLANSTNNKNSSNPSNIVNNTDSSNTGNPSSPPETINPSNEKTPGSTETSETIPKPPNVYDDAWV